MQRKLYLNRKYRTVQWMSTPIYDGPKMIGRDFEGGVKYRIHPTPDGRCRYIITHPEGSLSGYADTPAAAGRVAAQKVLKLKGLV